MKIFSILIALTLAAPAIGSAQTLDAADDLTGYTRFVVYPHLQQGRGAMDRGDRTRALSEFERARSLAPDSASVALQLASAYQRFGELSKAESLLRAQIRLTPRDARLLPALTAVQAVIADRSAPAAANGCRDKTAPRCNVPSASAQSANTASAASAVTTAPKPDAPRPAKARRTAPAASEAAVTADAGAETSEPGAAFTRALGQHEFDEASREGAAWLARDPGDPALLDRLTYQLVTAGASTQAADLLLEAYPFASSGMEQRELLLQRLFMALETDGNVSAERRASLRRPLDTPALRSRQAVWWTSLNDCGAVRSILADASPEYGYEDWLLLGNCSVTDDPGLAERAYAAAQTIQPGGRASLALGYQAFANGHFNVALGAWRNVAFEALGNDELLAAASTAVAVGANDQAVSWLDVYRGRGDTLGHRYWSVLADATLPSDPAQAADALTHAVDLQPDANDYLRLASIEQDAARRLQWLEGAAALEPGKAAIQAQLGYAYSGSGAVTSAISAFERAAALSPDDADVQRALGFEYLRAGSSAAAQRALDSAWRADPANQEIAQQLVYLNQQLKHNREAREYAERVIDALPASEAATSQARAFADQRFAFQRTHEDLGRRVTVNLDGWSGTSIGTGTSESRADRGYRSYSQAEVDVRLGSPAIRDGSTVSAYARVFADGGQLLSALPSENSVVAVGLSWKPWRNQVVYFAAEHQNGLANRERRDTLVRASASFFNTGLAGDDWHASGQGWFSRNLYLDVAQYLEASRTAMTADYRASYHRKVSIGQTVEPYGHLQANGARSLEFQRDVRLGAGIRWNAWYGGSRYDAAPHKFSLGVEFQQALKTYLPDRNGLFVSLGMRW
jgi:adsorption protein A